MQYRNRSRQCMKGWLLMFSSSLVKSRPPFSASYHAAIVAPREAELGLHRGAEERAAELVEALALDHDAGGRPVEGLHVGHGQAHVLEPQRLQGLEAEHVADDRGGEVG